MNATPLIARLGGVIEALISDVLSVETRTPPPIGEGVLLLSLLLYAVTLIVTVIVALV